MKNGFGDRGERKIYYCDRYFGRRYGDGDDGVFNLRFERMEERYS